MNSKALSIPFSLLLLSCGCQSLPEAGITHSSGALSQRVFVAQAGVPRISHLSSVPGSDEVCVAGRRRLARFDPEGNLRSRVAFEGRVVGPVPVDVEGNGSLSYMSSGGGWQPVGLFDAEGRPSWVLEDGPNAIAAADLNGDGLLEFLVGFNGGGGVAAYDSKGTRLWKQDAGNVWSVAAVDLDGNGTLEVLHSSARKGIVIRSSKGELLRTLEQTDGYFLVGHWPSLSAAPLLVYSTGGALQFLSLSGIPVGVLPLPFGGHAVKQAIPVAFGPSAETHFAVARTIHATGKRSALCVYDPNGVLVHSEVFAATDVALLAAPDPESGHQRLLVGVGSRVLSFTLKK